MEINVSQKYDTVFIIEIIGQCWETDNLYKLRENIDDIIEKGAHKVVVDLSRVSFVSSQGLGMFVSFYAALKKQGGEFIIFNPKGCVKETIELSGFQFFMNIIESENTIDGFISDQKDVIDKNSISQ